jgi:hypothetical protein
LVVSHAVQVGTLPCITAVLVYLHLRELSKRSGLASGPIG